MKMYNQLTYICPHRYKESHSSLLAESTVFANLPTCLNTFVLIIPASTCAFTFIHDPFKVWGSLRVAQHAGPPCRLNGTWLSPFFFQPPDCKQVCFSPVKSCRFAIWYSLLFPVKSISRRSVAVLRRSPCRLWCTLETARVHSVTFAWAWALVLLAGAQGQWLNNIQWKCLWTKTHIKRLQYFSFLSVVSLSTISGIHGQPQSKNVKWKVTEINNS